MNDITRIPRWLVWILLLIHVLAALPSYALLVAFVPRFAGLFDRLSSDGELPALTCCVMLLSKYVHPLFLLGLALDALVLSKLCGMRDFWPTLVWFIAVLVALLVLIPVTAIALLLPVWTLSATM